MNDYFKDICDWRDADERFVLHDHALDEGHGSLSIRGVAYRYVWIKRYWRVLGETEEQSKARGPMYELKLYTGEVRQDDGYKHALCSWGDTLEEALKRIEHCVCAWLDKKSKNSGDTP
jgi:hypothetical protein